MKKFNTTIYNIPAGETCYEVYQIGKKRELGRYFGTDESVALQCYGLLVDADKARVLYRDGNVVMKWE